MNLDGFLSWLQTSKVSAPQQQRIAEYTQTHGKTFSDMFDFIVASESKECYYLNN